MRYTEAPARRAELLRRLEVAGYVASAQLAVDFGVSEMTIRRDVRQLQLDGLARRVPGGATLAGGTGVPFDERTRASTADKHAIAAACAPLLAGAATIALDAGTTVAPVAELIAAGTTVVSHSVPVITACAERAELERIDVIGVGGVYQPDTRSFAGPAASAAIAALSFDVAVLSATAVDADGLMCANMLDADIKKQMSSSAATTILLADHTKLVTRAPIRVAPLSLIDVLVTDSHAPAELLDVFRSAGVRVVIATDVVLASGSALAAL
ncbi:DeoR/GlpR family DNA-binding transcription regulator [Okibacterium endophyticum]